MSKPVEDHAEDPRGPLTWDAIRVITVFTLACVAITVTVLVVYLVSFVGGQRRIQECLQVQVAELQTSYTAAVTAGRRDRQSQRELLLSGADPDAIRVFLGRLDEADRGRTSAPPPTRNCL